MLEVFKGLAACGLCMKLERVDTNIICKNQHKYFLQFDTNTFCNLIQILSSGLWVVYEVGESCNQATKQSHRIFCNLPFLSVVDQDERE